MTDKPFKLTLKNVATGKNETFTADDKGEVRIPCNRHYTSAESIDVPSNVHIGAVLFSEKDKGTVSSDAPGLAGSVRGFKRVFENLLFVR